MRIAIIGGGVIGAGIAWRLAGRGAQVTIIDDHQLAGAASRAAGGMLAPLAEARTPGPFLDLGLESLRRYPAFVAQLEQEAGMAVGYARAGKLIAASSRAEADDLAATYRWQGDSSDAHAEWLDGAQARTLEPGLSPDVRAAVLIRDDHRVDNVLLADALARAAALAGARAIATRAARIRTKGGRVTGVETARGETIDADAVVLAAGAWSGAIDGLPRALPVRPVRGQMLALRPARPLFGRTLSSAQVYLVPRADGRVIVGSTMEEGGFATWTSAETIAALHAAAATLVPELAHAPRAGAWAGLRPATPDELPILGPDPALSGLFHATGHFRNGILLAPVTADAVSAAILGESDVDLAPYSPARFDVAPPSHAAAPAIETAIESAVEDDLTCDLCGSAMYEVHCKVICRSCGYKRDCSDLW